MPRGRRVRQGPDQPVTTVRRQASGVSPPAVARTTPRRGPRPGRVDLPRCRPVPALLPGVCCSSALGRGGRSLTQLRQPPSPPRTMPTAEVPPSRVVDCGGVAPRWAAPAGADSRDRRRRRDRRRLRRSQPPMPQRPPLRRRGPRHPGSHALPPDAPSPGTSGTPGRPTRGSTPPDGQGRVEPAAPRRNSGADGPAGRHAHPGHLPTRRTGKPVNRPRWAALGPSSAR